jgi:hypothetical protein
MSLFVEPQEFSALFIGHPAPARLLRLLDYQNSKGYGSYSQALSLSSEEQSGLIHGWCAEQGFLDGLIAIAQANGSGSFYALWNNHTTADPELWPVVAFGDEGGEWVVARNLAELLQLSTFDAEPMIDNTGVTFYKDLDSFEPSEYADDYQGWLQSEFGIQCTEDPETIGARARAEFQQAFDDWVSPYFETWSRRNRSDVA